MQKFLLPQYLAVKAVWIFWNWSDWGPTHVLQKLIISGKFRQPIIRTHLDYQKREMQCRFFECIAFRNLEKKLTLGKILLQSPPSALMVAVLCSFYVKYDSKIIISARWKIKNITEYAPAVTLIHRNNCIPQSWISSDTHYFICCGSAFNSSFLKPFQ